MDKKLIKGYEHVSYSRASYTPAEMIERSRDFYKWMDKRRTVRDFSNKPVPREVIDNILLAASTAPSGAHKQPWTFCVVSSAEIKSQIREAAEKEEQENYQGRMSDEWLKDLEQIGTDAVKAFLETAPYLIVVFKKIYELDENGKKMNNYYVSESVGLACGMLLTAIHQAGLVALTHTPSPMNFLSEVLKRPKNERAYLLIPVGYVSDVAYVPDLKRKKLENIAVYY